MAMALQSMPARQESYQSRVRGLSSSGIESQVRSQSLLGDLQYAFAGVSNCLESQAGVLLERTAMRPHGGIRVREAEGNEYVRRLTNEQRGSSTKRC
jgi:hypothetical protein